MGEGELKGNNYSAKSNVVNREVLHGVGADGVGVKSPFLQ